MFVKKMKLKVIKNVIVVLSIILLFSGYKVEAFDKLGTTGDVSWSFDRGVLTISGKGEMADYSDSQLAPWYSFRDNILEVKIENGVKKVGILAFYDCTNLKRVVLSNSVENIDNFAFKDCTNLKVVEIGKKLKYIGRAAFKLCQSLESIVLPNGLITIGEEAFYMCSSLTSITIPKSIENLGVSSFAYCEKLGQVIIEASIDTLPSLCFYSCNSLTTVSLSENISSIGDGAFGKCNQLKYIKSDANEEMSDKIVQDIKNDAGIKVEVLDKTDDLSSINNDSIIIENDNIIIENTLNNDNSNDTIINVTIKNENGWDDIKSKVDDLTNHNDSWKDDNQVNINVNLTDNQKVSGDVLEHFAGKNVNLNINGVIEAKIDCKKLNKKQNYSDFSLNYNLQIIDNPSKNIINVIGNSIGYFLKFNGNTDFDVIVKIPFGKENASYHATLYQKNGAGYNYIQSVIIDDDGYASFYFASFDSYTKYLIGINVDGSEGNAIVPENLFGVNNIIVDEHGNKYQITGVKSKWGISLGTFSLIIFGAVTVVVLIIGGVMFMMFKRQQANEKIRREVMSEGYSKEDNIKKTKITKSKLFNKKKI